MQDITIIRSKRKTVTLNVSLDGTIIVKTPLKVSEKEIYRFIEQNESWIEEKKKRIAQTSHLVTMQYKTSEEFWYLGKLLKLDIGNYKTIEVKEDKLLFPKFLEFRIQKELINWYKKQAKNIITTQVASYAGQMNADYLTLTFSETKSRWGSCTSKNELQFNWKLVMAPLLTINYVVVHELAHTFEKNHGQKFWTKVRFFCPSYKNQRVWLKRHGDLLVV